MFPSKLVSKKLYLTCSLLFLPKVLFSFWNALYYWLQIFMICSALHLQIKVCLKTFERKIIREKNCSPALLCTRSSSTCTSAQESRSKDIRNTSFWVIRMSPIWISIWTRKTFYVDYIECHWTEYEHEQVQVSRSSW